MHIHSYGFVSSLESDAKKFHFELYIGYANLGPDRLQLIILSYCLSAYNHKNVSKEFENYKDKELR